MHIPGAPNDDAETMARHRLHTNAGDRDPPTFASTNGENQGKTPTIQGQQKANGARIFCSKTYTFADEWRLLHNKGANHNGPKRAPSIQQKHENDD